MGAHCQTCTCRGSWITVDEMERLAKDTGAVMEVDAERNRYVLSLGGAEFNARMRTNEGGVA
jgi:hypothetical protein